MVLVVDKLRRSVADEMYPYRRQRHRGLHLTVLVIIFNLLTIPRVERDFAKDPEGAVGWRLLTVQQRCILGYRPRVYVYDCLLYTSPSPRDGLLSRMPSSA